MSLLCALVSQWRESGPWRHDVAQNNGFRGVHSLLDLDNLLDVHRIWNHHLLPGSIIHAAIFTYLHGVTEEMCKARDLQGLP